MAHWSLYWVESDGFEDCFVVARNTRSACLVEIDMNGFGYEDVQALKILRIPEAVEKRFNKKRDGSQRPWPWYVYGKSFFKSVGAEFRTVKKQQEMLLEEVVYLVEDYVPCGMTKKEEHRSPRNRRNA